MTIFICGDSTAASYGPEMTPFMGWGQALAEDLPDTPIENTAFAGRSTKTFLSEGRLDRIRPMMQPGDLVMIQFGHNDAGDKPERHTDLPEFAANLTAFVDAARAAGAEPVLMTPTCVRCFRDGVLQPSLGEYPEAVRRLAAQLEVPLIDMYQKTTAHITALGDADSRGLYMNLEPGVWPNFPEGRVDDTHTQPAGARAYARMVAEALRELGLA